MGLERNKIYTGHALEILRTFPDKTFHACITSPPYWGLRDYGITEQIGLEKTPEEYVSKLVEVFREVRRVLRDDGILWLNLGISYAGSWGDSGHRPERTGENGHQREKKTKWFRRQGHPQNAKPVTASCCDKHSIQSPLLWRAPACGNDGKGFQGSQVDGRVCPCSDDVSQDANQTHHLDNARNAQFEQQDEQQTSQINHDNVRADYDQASPDALLPGALESTMLQSAAQLSEDACGHEATSEACQQGLQTSSADVRASVDMSVCISGTSLKSPPLVVRTADKESFFSACQSPDCRGIGRCGLCWCKLAIPSLNVKPKDEINIPHLVAMALQADGWILRETICWNKPNAMPESVQDRPSRSHEYIFLLSKSARYYYDHEAIKEPSTERASGNLERKVATEGEESRTNTHLGYSVPYEPDGTGRNRRSVWTISVKGFRGAHFATFPVALVTPMILAGCPGQCCPKCGKGWERVTEHESRQEQATWSGSGRANGCPVGGGHKGRTGQWSAETRTLGFRPVCNCGETANIPGIVLDLFAGSGTVAETAIRLGRDYVLIEPNPQYVKIAEKRIADCWASLPTMQETILPGFEAPKQSAPKRKVYEEMKLL